ncbi:MAG TPA: ECF-type sigma factor [Steroidobacteraceae bacterium]|nr:ECF-type sigma factor [Steroidobacteraceae bacterium]
MGEVTHLLRAANGGDRSAADRLFALMYEELKRLARGSLRKHAAGGELDLHTTMLVHESFLRLVGGEACAPADRLAFYSYIGKVMRSVVLDCVREGQARKRGGDQSFVTLTTGVPEQVLDSAELVALEDALSALERLAPDLRELVELRYFAGLTVAEISELTGRPLRSVEREWHKARLLLQQLMTEA